MKKIFSFFAAILFAGSMMAAVQEFSVTITKADFNKTSYAANNNEKTVEAVATADPTVKLSVKWTSNQMMLKSDQTCVQSQKSNGAIYNAVSWGTIKSVTIEDGTNLNYTIGASAQPTASATGGFFQVKNNSTGTGYFTSITIVFEADASVASLHADDVVLGEVLCEPGDQFVKVDSAVVEAANLTSGISFSTNSTKLAFVTTDDLPAEGGVLKFQITADAGDDLSEEIYLVSGEVKDTLVVTGKVFEKFYNPGTAAEFEAGVKAMGGDSTLVNGQKAVKVGTSSDPGTAIITVPAKTKKVYMLAAAWANKACTMTLEADGITLDETSFDLTADAGIAGSGSVFTTAKGDLTAYQVVVNLSGVTAETEITATATGSNKRFVIWDVTYELETPTAIENAEAEVKAIKRFENGVLIIEKNGVKYNAQGAVVK